MTADQYAGTSACVEKTRAHMDALASHVTRCARPVRTYAHGSRHADPARGSFNVKPKNRRRGRR